MQLKFNKSFLLLLGRVAASLIVILWNFLSSTTSSLFDKRMMTISSTTSEVSLRTGLHDRVDVVDVAAMVTAVKPDEFPCPTKQFLDIGANVGIYSLPAVLVGAKASAPEPIAGTVRRLARPVHILAGNLTSGDGDDGGGVTLFNNAVSDGHSTQALAAEPKNQSNFNLEQLVRRERGTSLLRDECQDDHARRPPATDGEGQKLRHEGRYSWKRDTRFRTSTRFVRTIDVDAIPMELSFYTGRCPDEAVDEFVKFFYRDNFSA